MLQPSPTCEALVVTCLDFRFQSFFERWLGRTLGYGNFDRLALAGSIKDWEIVFAQIELARDLHGIRRVVLVNHEDCRAYGEAGTFERHRHDLRQARENILAKYPALQVDMFYSRLDGTFERVEAF
jgi:carbonic anhydrase